MAETQLWVYDINGALVHYVDAWLTLHYSQRLNALGTITMQLAPNDDKIPDLDIADSSNVDRLRRAKITRDGGIAFKGFFEHAELTLPEEAPDGETWVEIGPDQAAYLDWRLIVPGASASTYDVTAAADNVLKNLVKNHAGSSAIAARQFTDLTVEGDESAAPSYELHERYTILIDILSTVAQRDKVWWRMLPTAGGVTFETAYPLYGVDRTRGNAAHNSECIFTLDRRNWRAFQWARDRLSMANHVYVGGANEGANRKIVEREDATSVASCLRRERFINSNQLSITAALQARGDSALKELQATQTMTAKPFSTSWKATSGTTWDLGDKVTVDIQPETVHRPLTVNAIITGIDVTIGQDGVEVVEPILEKA